MLPPLCSGSILGHQLIEHPKAQMDARGEHASPVIKRRFGNVKVRYRGLTKMHTLFALANI